MKNLMEERNAVAQFARAATLYREQGGLKQLIAIAQEGVAPAGQAQDYTDYEIARHGVALSWGFFSFLVFCQFSLIFDSFCVFDRFS